jgi:hypothetical protein
VKEGNPGYDLLFSRNWDAILKVEKITADSEIIKRNLEVVTFNPGEESGAGNSREGSGYKSLLIGLVVFNLLAFGVFSYLRYRNRAAAS